MRPESRPNFWAKYILKNGTIRPAPQPIKKVYMTNFLYRRRPDLRGRSSSASAAGRGTAFFSAPGAEFGAFFVIRKSGRAETSISVIDISIE
ncbi:MAG: hypothetical protein ACD_47C00510G0002 [uncultured bacterium]|nr:MAG: hypothetical protein ACD_47C00510G0002 [uncultured bacterium]